MAKSNLATIDRTFEAAIAEAASPATLERIAGTNPSFRRFSGFVVRDPSGDDAKVRTHKETLRRYHDDRGQLFTTLQRYDIKPLAMLPLAAWNRLCDQSGLHRLSPNENGEIRVDTSKVKSFARWGTFLSVLFWAMPYVAVCTVAGIRNTGKMYVFAVVLSLAYALLFNAMLLGVVFDGMSYVCVHYRLTRLACRIWAATHSWESIVRVMLPKDMIEDYGIGGRRKATLVLPPPPEDVVEILKRLHSNVRVSLAVEPNAFRFAEPIPDIFADEIRDDSHQRAMRMVERMRLDPIGYVVYGKAVAIVFQFGDFPIEQAVVDEVAAVEYLEF